MNIETKRHSLAHIMAQAVKEMYPNAKMAIGPDIENGFYYDFDFGNDEFKEENLKDLEKKMKKIVSQNQKFEQYDLPYVEAVKFLKEKGEDYKVEMATELKEKGIENISFYKNIMQNGNESFVDMCSGPHVDNTNKIDANAFALDKIAGAYWKGDSNKKMLTRIYAFAFDTKEELDNHIKMIEEAKRRDHRVLGEKLQLFTFDNEVGPGLPLWLPAGATMVEEIEKLAKQKEEEYGYQRVRTPHITKGELYYKSGHLPYYKESMFPSMNLDGEEYYLKPMNCPHHHKLYDAIPKSYRDLPVRFAEYGHCYRYEDSGSLFGLMRVRSLCMNDAHIYCTEEQFEDEFIKVIEMYKFYFDLFGVDKFQMRLSKHSKEGLGKKYVDNESLWIKTEEQVRSALIKTGVPFVEAEDEAAFYGPKIDVQIWSAIGREFTLATNQLDFAVPERFSLTYKDSDGSDKTPICIHRAPLSTHERLIGFLIEHFAGIFPLWLAPRQVIVVPVSDKFDSYAKKVESSLKQEGIRVTVDLSSDGLNKKVRNAEKMHINYILIVGEQEELNNSVSVRNYKTKEQKVITINEFVKEITNEISDRVK
nr:threonine--tRNA ligase [Candidatus Gracilibacteria bacterium]